jgi:hypothetical protein
MDDADHCACMRSFLNPSFARRTADAAGELRPGADDSGELLAQRKRGPDRRRILPRRPFHAMLALSRVAATDAAGDHHAPDGTAVPRLCDHGQRHAGGARQEVRREEQATERLRGEYAEKPRASLLVALRKKERKVEALSGGFARPFHVTYLIRVWAPTREALREKIAAVQAAVNAMDGAQYLECALPTTAKKLFFGSWPGWTHSSYRHRELYAEDTYLADLLPFSATFVGALDHRGGDLRRQPRQSRRRQHPDRWRVAATRRGDRHDRRRQVRGDRTICFCKPPHRSTTPSSSRKGFSYKRFTERMGESPIVVHPDAPLTSTISTPQHCRSPNFISRRRWRCWRAWSASPNRAAAGAPAGATCTNTCTSSIATPTSTGHGATRPGRGGPPPGVRRASVARGHARRRDSAGGLCRVS